MLKIRDEIFTFNEDEQEYMGYLSIWNKKQKFIFMVLSIEIMKKI